MIGYIVQCLLQVFVLLVIYLSKSFFQLFTQNCQNSWPFFDLIRLRHDFFLMPDSCNSTWNNSTLTPISYSMIKVKLQMRSATTIIVNQRLLCAWTLVMIKKFSSKFASRANRQTAFKQICAAISSLAVMMLHLWKWPSPNTVPNTLNTLVVLSLRAGDSYKSVQCVQCWIRNGFLNTKFVATPVLLLLVFWWNQVGQSPRWKSAALAMHLAKLWQPYLTTTHSGDLHSTEIHPITVVRQNLSAAMGKTSATTYTWFFPVPFDKNFIY